MAAIDGGDGGAYNARMRNEEIRQYSVLVADSEALRRIERVLAGEKICRKSLLTATSRGRAVAQFLARHSSALREKLERSGGLVRENQVFQVELDAPAQLARLTASFAQAGINILSLYTEREGEGLRAVLAAEPTANAVELARKMGLRPDYHVFDIRA